MKDFAVYSDRSNLAGTADELAELANDHKAREARRQRCFEIAKAHCGNDVVYRQMHLDAIATKKRNPSIESEPPKPSALF
jgi:hypothetical protein